jgi:hypothetical protein
LTLNADNTALLKVDNDTLDVKWWKLVFEPAGAIEMYKGYATLRLITSVNVPPTFTQMSLSPPGAQKKTYLAAIKLDASLTDMDMIVDFKNGTSLKTGFGSSAVEIAFTK